MSDDKQIVEYSVNDVVSHDVQPGIQGGLLILLRTDHDQNVALKLPPKAVATLESMLAAVREHQAESSGIQ